MRIEKRGAHVATAVGELEGHEAGLVVLREGLRGGGLVHRVVPQQRAHICARSHGRHATSFEHGSDGELDYTQAQRSEGGRRVGLAFGDVMDLACWRVG
jgi:hypothetical protein